MKLLSLIFVAFPVAESESMWDFVWTPTCWIEDLNRNPCDRKPNKEKDSISNLFRTVRKPPKPEYSCEKPLDPYVKIFNCAKKESKRFANIFKKLTFCEVSCQNGKTPSSTEVACEKLGKKKFKWTSSVKCL